ncbi:MAG: hypothetical protein RL701_2274 [Pseudomonadota bacterium]
MGRLSLNTLVLLWKETIRQWTRHNASRLSAALAFYALLSMAPLLLVTVLVMGLFFGEEDGRMRTISAVSAIVGKQGTAALEMLAQSAHRDGDNTLRSLVAVMVALFGASGVFVELQASLNTIWEVPERPDRPAVLSYLIGRFWSFVMVLAAAALLLFSVISSALLTIVTEFFQNFLPGSEVAWHWLHFGVSLSLLSLVFALIFRVVPDVAVTWTDVALGSLMTALLFVFGNMLLGEYLGKSGITSSFGGAGSVVALVIWVYYSAQIVFLGAEFTHVYAKKLGSLQTKDASS